MKNVYCIGEMLIDFVAEKQGSNLTKATTFTKKAGGAPANVAAAIAKLGGNSYFVGCVGKDPFGQFLVNTMEELGVKLNFTQRSSTFTTLAFVSIAEDGERDFVFSRGADKELEYDTKLASVITDEILHFGAATALLGGSLEDSYSRYLQNAKKQGSFISFDPNFRGDLWKGTEKEFVQKCLPFVASCDFAKFSLEEALLISGEKNIDDACRKLHELGAGIIAITLGKDGTFLSTSTRQEVIGSIAVKPVDTTGAGDAFVGCLLYQISMLNNPKKEVANFTLLKQLITTANKAGAITTTQYGAIAALPTMHQLNQF